MIHFSTLYILLRIVTKYKIISNNKNVMIKNRVDDLFLMGTCTTAYAAVFSQNSIRWSHICIHTNKWIWCNKLCYISKRIITKNMHIILSVKIFWFNIHSLNNRYWLWITDFVETSIFTKRLKNDAPFADSVWICQVNELFHLWFLTWTKKGTRKWMNTARNHFIQDMPK